MEAALGRSRLNCSSDETVVDDPMQEEPEPWSSA
jgi:hypothetical protein